jgi:hypothetical protein
MVSRAATNNTTTDNDNLCTILHDFSPNNSCSILAADVILCFVFCVLCLVFGVWYLPLANCYWWLTAYGF